jgi:hypothetical protein
MSPRITFEGDGEEKSVKRVEWEEEDGFVIARNPAQDPESRIVIPKERVISIRYPVR